MIKRPWVVKLSLLFISISLSFLLAELVFRQLLFSDSNFFPHLKNPGFYVNPFRFNGHASYGEDFWKLNYLFNRQFNIDEPHPLLGWTGILNHKTLEHPSSNKVGKKRPVLLYGDSFAQCMDGTICFQEILNSDSSFSSQYYMLNHGVGGYGVDQIYLLFRETVDTYENPFVIFSLLTTDMDRCLLGVRDAQKPYFHRKEDSLILKGVPIEMSSEEYFDANPPAITSYLFNLFLNHYVRSDKSDTRDEKHMENIKSINTKILEVAFEKLSEFDGNYMVLVFQPEAHGAGDWRLPYLRNILEKNNIPYICDLDYREMDIKDQIYDPSKYALPNDGHPTTYANRIIANELKACILDSSYRGEAFAYAMKWKERKPVIGVEYYRKQILDSPEWVARVKVKAESKGISLDSMITLDAIYMVNH